METTTGHKTFNFDLPTDVEKNTKHENDSIIKHTELFAEHTIKRGLGSYCPNISMETIFMNTENSRRNEPQEFVLNLSPRLDFKSLYKHVAL